MTERECRTLAQLKKKANKLKDDLDAFMRQIERLLEQKKPPS
jgi:DNA-directed RNA polymerase subunit L